MRLIVVIVSLMVLTNCSAIANEQAPPTGSVDFGSETLGLINSYRTGRGLPPLVEHPALRALAAGHSQNQAARGRMHHDGFQQRMAQARTGGAGARCAENVGHRYRSAQQLFEGWRNSTIHRENMLRPHLRFASVSVVGAYATYFACG